jgi:hypothetical protein
MARSRVPTTTNSPFSISPAPMSAPRPLYLTQYGLMAEKHWRTFCPRMVARLEMEGTLMVSLWEAQETTLDEIELLTRKLEREQQLTPGQAQTTAWELVREKYILLPPENPNG